MFKLSRDLLRPRNYLTSRWSIYQEPFMVSHQQLVSHHCGSADIMVCHVILRCHFIKRLCDSMGGSIVSHYPVKVLWSWTLWY